MRRLPISLQVLAAFFIFEGVWAMIRSRTAWTHAQPEVPLDAIGVFIGVGLLRRRNGWRAFGVGWLWVWLVLTLACLTWFAFSGHPVQYSAPVPRWYPKPDIFLAAYLASFLVASLWGISVLTSPHVNACFQSGTSANNDSAAPDGDAATREFESMPRAANPGTCADFVRDAADEKQCDR